MILWLSPVSLMAQETPDEVTPSEEVSASTGNTQLEALETRLLGEIAEEVPSSSYEAGELSGGLWLVPVFVFMIAVILWSKFRKKSPINPGEIRVMSRTPMGKEGSFAIIHVGGEEGSNQKMLVGLSEQGAPRLLSVLTADWREQDVASASADFDQFLNTMSNEEKVVEDTTHLEDRNDLVEELLNARGVDQQQLHTDGAFEGEEPLDEDDPWVVNFRHKYQSQT